MLLKPIPCYLPKLLTTNKWSLRRATRPSVLEHKINKDTFIKTKTPALKCARGFLVNIEFSQAVKNLSKQDIYSLNITNNIINKTVVVEGQPKLTSSINSFIKEFPEFFNIFNPKADEPNLSKHVLATYNQLLNHRDYNNLSKKQQNILDISVLLHDTGKSIESGRSHPDLSVKMIRETLNSKLLEEKEKNLILKLIKYHHYSESIAKGWNTYDDYVHVFNQREFNLLKILTDVDIKSKTKPIQHLLEENSIFFSEQEKAFARSDINKLNLVA